ncbi:MAG: Mur ligase family protein, partial [Ethanoligenens sp.]
MKFQSLLKDVSYTGVLPEIEITDLTADSRKAGPGVLFVCIPGERSDGHDFAAAAAAAGSPAVIALRDTGAPVPHILVKDTRFAYALCCANFFGRPAERLRLVGLTGTNGKTTTTTLIKEILEYNGHKSGLIGTIANMAGSKVLPSHLTTPEPYEFQQLLKTIADEGCEFAVMEVSSHALAQERVAGCHFETAVFTNLTQDHLDFHKTMENYLQAKEKLFSMCDLGIVNVDDDYAAEVIRTAKCKIQTYSARYMNADYT